MRKITLALAILGTTLVPALYTAPAHAQATRTWVSGVGDDANPCSRTAPCKTFAGAISKTATGGEINCLDPAGFGALTITKAINIDCRSVSNGGVLITGTPGITVAAGPADKVTLDGLDIFSTGTGTNGVNFISGLTLIIRNTRIMNFTNAGVNVASNTAGARAVIQNCLIAFNGGAANTGGVLVQGNGTGNVVQIIDTLLQNNAPNGVLVTGNTNGVAFIRSIVTPTNIVSVNNGSLVSIGPSNVFAGVTGTLSPANFQ